MNKTIPCTSKNEIADKVVIKYYQNQRRLTFSFVIFFDFLESPLRCAEDIVIFPPIPAPPSPAPFPPSPHPPLSSPHHTPPAAAFHPCFTLPHLPVTTDHTHSALLLVPNSRTGNNGVVRYKVSESEDERVI